MASKTRTPTRASVRRAAFIFAVLVYAGERLLLDAYTETYARSYRPPVIALAHPAPGGSVAEQRPVIVLRFVPGEPRDPVDLSTLAITVDGEDHTTWFEIASTEAWGPLITASRDGARHPRDTPAASEGGTLHRISARICSVRGACGQMGAIVRVGGATASTTARAPASVPDENGR